MSNICDFIANISTVGSTRSFNVSSNLVTDGSITVGLGCVSFQLLK